MIETITVDPFDSSSPKWLIDGLVHGMIVGLALYNTIFAAFMRDKNHLYFGLYGIAVFFYSLLSLGYLEAFLWPGNFLLNSICSWLSLAAALVLFSRFTCSFLKTKENFPRGHRVFRIIGLLFPIIALLGIAGNWYVGLRFFAFFSNVILAIILFGGAMLGAIYLWRENESYAKSFLAANTFFCISGIFYALSIFELFPDNYITSLNVQIGVILQQFLISVGIADQIQDLQSRMILQAMEQEKERKEFVERKNTELEMTVNERTAELKREKGESEKLLLNILPEQVVAELKANSAVAPRRHEEITILFTDFKGFTNTVAAIPAHKLVGELNEIFIEFDRISQKHGIEKIKTIGDAYMVVGGLFDEQMAHAVACVRAAWEMHQFLAQRNEEKAIKWHMRAGVHTGSAISGIVGIHKFAYDIWGDSVNIASRMEQACESGRINVSAYTYDLIREKIKCTYRGKNEAKGKGEMDMYFVDSCD